MYVVADPAHAPVHGVPGGIATRDRCRKRMRPSRPVSQAQAPPSSGEEPTLREAGFRWLRTYVATTRNEKGQRLAAVRFDKYVLDWLDCRTPRDVTGDDIRYLRQVLEGYWSLSPYTVTHVLSDLRCFLRWAVSVELIERSPFPARVMPRIPEVPPRGFDEREVAVLSSVPGHGGFVLRFLLGTGLRWAEACRARREHIRGVLLEVSHTKSGRVRRVPLSPELLREIDACEPQLVPYAAGSPGSFSRVIRRYTGIADFHVHRCRHTFAMRWLAAGGNLAVLQQILGHRDLSTTMRYARVTDELIEREAARVTQRQGGAGPL
jgi:integrase